jgi:hypothetical protein
MSLKKKKNFFMRFMAWIAEGASKAEIRGGACAT